MKGRGTFFDPKQLLRVFLHLMVLFLKVLSNHSSNHQFLVIRCRTPNNNREAYHHKFYLLRRGWHWQAVHETEDLLVLIINEMTLCHNLGFFAHSEEISLSQL